MGSEKAGNFFEAEKKCFEVYLPFLNRDYYYNFFVPVTLKNRYVGNMCKCMAEFIDLFHKLYYL